MLLEDEPSTSVLEIGCRVDHRYRNYCGEQFFLISGRNAAILCIDPGTATRRSSVGRGNLWTLGNIYIMNPLRHSTLSVAYVRRLVGSSDTRHRVAHSQKPGPTTLPRTAGDYTVILDLFCPLWGMGSIFRSIDKWG